MDRLGKTVVALSFVLLIAWTFWSQRSLGNRPPNSLTNAAVGGVATTDVTSTLPRINAPATGSSASTPLSNPGTPTPRRSNTTETLLTDENEAVRMTITSRGGGIQSVELKGIPEIVPCGPDQKSSGTNWVTLNRAAASPMFSLSGGIDDDGDFTLTKVAGGIQAEKMTASGLRIIKTFSPSTNHDIRVIVRLENTSRQPLSLPARRIATGVAIPANAMEGGTSLNGMWWDGQRADTIQEAWFANRTLGCVPGTPRPEYLGGTSNVVWTAVNNQFFSLITIPSNPGYQVSMHPEAIQPVWQTASIHQRPPPVPSGIAAYLVSPALTLAPDMASEETFSVYAGPKKYFDLSRREPMLDRVLDFTGFSGFFAKLLLLGMTGLNKLGMSYGGCIIAITVIIKMVFWPLTAASTRSMKRMGELQPQMKAIQEKYKDDPKKVNEKTMQFMRENRVNPAAGCLPIVVQIPVFFGLFTMLRGAIELRGASFLWMCDLSAPDTLFYIPFLGLPFNFMPLIYIGTALWQTHLTPISPQMDPVQQKMMRYMPLMFLVLFYNYSCGLALYWTVQNLLTILQMKLTNSKSTPTTPPPASGSAVASLPRVRNR